MPDFYYKLLLDIYKKPYIGYAVLRSKYPHKQDFEFQQAFEFFQFNDYIVINPFKSADTDTGEVFSFHKPNGVIKPVSLCPYMHLILSVSGTAYVDERRRRFWGFVLPYVITTAISLASIFLQFYNTFFA